MKVLSADQIRKADVYTILHEPISSIDLMERAASNCFEKLISIYPDHKFLVLCGPGNNGGDGLALSRMLFSSGRSIKVFLLESEKYSADNLENQSRLSSLDVNWTTTSVLRSSDLEGNWVIIDALFGTGLNRPLSGVVCDWIRIINESSNEVISIDMPSGMFAEDNFANEHEKVVVANHTLSFQCWKLSFLLADYGNHIGQIHILDIGLNSEFIRQSDSPYHVLSEHEVNEMIIPRKKFSHKGTYGSTLLMAGSGGMMGAALIAAKGAVSSGAGLVYVQAPVNEKAIIQIGVPEVIFIPEIEHLDYTSIGIGPGCGVSDELASKIENVLSNFKGPIVLDADALNTITIKNLHGLIDNRCILTPHPKEFDRLFGFSETSFDRLQKQRAFSKRTGAIIVLKGAHTSITDSDGNVYFNASGNPYMATGGMGDALTGLICSLLAQGYSNKTAATLGVHYHGLAGDEVIQKSILKGISVTDLFDSKTWKSIGH
jgi:hydroxyethylthiazole kinase-like uncharacterized protein yjeF